MPRATSIISISGAGASLEAHIAATYLAATILRASGPGDDATHVVTRVEFQRTQPAAGFDDLHVHHAAPSGAELTTYMQVKRTLTGTRSEEAFRRPIEDAARLLADSDHSAVAWVIEQETGHADPETAWKVIARMGVVVIDAD